MAQLGNLQDKQDYDRSYQEGCQEQAARTLA